ncbi:hypothetical protein GUITHDRAFT_119759 [Guillardia theta CCMP2712]|uniref:Uncharacterized protein n=1 Tax=Guillardia theta (strain CCMP2712) TaxID=905079 RepID=L1ICX5_GUITC|nr:hypothetical protein GUITHDRAFT_119759 [Guillardia theta CCMP2712]EKX34088.1 hypothetical protein GUITHDRAFT_119759 [Guillardia theta CCMP2712]|eukprot:XP_005821068.1 hypothetical protein GUITHDRAFT_119759 [Guillardia theta CCMP2712]
MRRQEEEAMEVPKLTTPQAVADQRAKELDAMVDSDRHAALQRVKAKAAALARRPTAREQAKSPAETQHKVVKAKEAGGATGESGAKKLQAYLREEKALKEKIKRAEEAAAKRDKGEEGTEAAGRGRGGAEGTVVSTLAKTLYANKQTIAKDEKIAAMLRKQQDSLQQDMQRLKRKNDMLAQQKHSS